MKKIARVFPILIATAVAVGIQRPVPAGTQALPPRQVVLVTIDGMRGDYLSEADRYHLNIPHLRELMRGGSYSGRTISVFPTLTGTAHTSLVTGTGAAKHGILGNNRFDPSRWVYRADNPDNYDAQPAYRDYSEIKVGTLWSAAQAKGLKTAAIGWPQTAGGPIDYRIDMLMATTAAESHARTSSSASPGWLDKVEATLGPAEATDLRGVDHMKTLIAVQMLKQFKPALMAVHFTLTDVVQHANGPSTAAAFAALEEEDQNIGDLVAGIAASGIGSSTTLIVTGDHGFLPMHTALAVNLPLVEAGLITKGADGHPAWAAIVAPNRGLGSVYLKEKSSSTAAQARRALERYEALYPSRFRMVERSELDRWGADPDAAFGVEPMPGYVLDGRLAGPFAQPFSGAGGHGYRPDTPGMETGFIANGAGIRTGVVLPLTGTIDVAPTIAWILHLELPDAEGKPIVGIFSSPYAAPN